MEDSGAAAMKRILHMILWPIALIVMTLVSLFEAIHEGLKDFRSGFAYRWGWTFPSSELRKSFIKTYSFRTPTE